MAKKIELLHTTYDKSGNIESQEVVHPLTSPDCIVMENGKTLDEVMGDGIATPTLTHEGTSFKVGVGDSNIEVVDGDVAGMTLKGQSYQNILPKPTTLIMETDEKEFKINDKIDSNIIIDDNIAEIATIKGKTIVNAVQEESVSEYTVLGEDLSGQSIAYVKETPTLEGQTLVNHVPKFEKIMPIGTGSHRTVYSGIPSKPLKPNTSYLFINHSNVGYKLNVSIKGETTSEKLVISNLITSMHKFTTPDNTEDFTRIMVYLMSDNESELTYNTFMIIEYQEGMENWDIPYFEGEKYFESNIKGVTLQGQTLVNTIQEPCKDDYVVLGAEDGIEISAETGGHGTIEDTVQGNVKSAILKGNTLVNLSNLEEKIDRIPNSAIIMNEYGKVTYGKKYLVSVDIVSLNDIAKIKFEACKDGAWIADIIYPTSITLGRNWFVLDLTNTAFNGANGIKVTNPSSSTTNLTLQKCMIIEYQDGMENWDIPYFEGMTSVKMPVLTTTGKNLVSGNFKVADYRSSKPVIYSDSSVVTYPYTTNSNSRGVALVTRVEQNTSYSLSITNPIDNSVLLCSGYENLSDIGSYAKAVLQVGNSDVSSIKELKFTTPNNCRYIVFGSFNNYNNEVNGKNITFNEPPRIQLEEGTQATSFEEHKSNILTVNEPVELRGIGNVKDELNLITGELTERIGEVVFDGSDDEKWEFDNTSNLSNTNRFYTKNVIVDDAKLSPSNTLNDVGLIDLPTGTSINDNEHICIVGGKVYIRKNKTECSDLSTFKNWLSSNPITVQYELATKSVKTVDLTVTNQDGNTIPHIQTQPTVTHITASSNHLIPTVTIDNNLAYDTIIKPSTLYTVRFKHDTVNTDNPLTVDLGGTVQTVTSTEFTITTPSELTHNQLVFSGKNNVVSEVQVIEGDVTNIEYPFFEGMSDVKFSDGKFIARNCPFIFGKGGRI